MATKKRMTVTKAPITKVLKKKATKTKATKVVKGFNRTDVIKNEFGDIRLVLQSSEDNGSISFTISDLSNCVSMYDYCTEEKESKNFINMLETLADHILELKWHIEENV